MMDQQIVRILVLPWKRIPQISREESVGGHGSEICHSPGSGSEVTSAVVPGWQEYWDRLFLGVGGSDSPQLGRAGLRTPTQTAL